MRDTRISARGVYYDLSISPYVYRSPYGEIFKFSSRKKLEMYSRKIAEFKNKLEQHLSFFKDDESSWKDPARDITMKAYYKKLYNEVEVLNTWQGEYENKTKTV